MAFNSDPGAVRGYKSPVIIDTRPIAKQFGSLTEGSSPDVVVVDPNQPHNATFDARIWGVGGLKKQRLLRGRLSMLTGEKPGAFGARLGLHRSLNFLYNPESITQGFVYGGQTPEDFIPEGAEGASLIQGQSFAFNLQFNRIYESAMERDGGAGVLADTKALELMLGVATGSALYSRDLLAVFGVTQASKPFAFRGWVDSCSITYTHFNHRMVPIVALVELRMARRVNPDASSIHTNIVGGQSGAGGSNAAGYPTSQPGGVPGRQAEINTQTVAPDASVFIGQTARGRGPVVGGSTTPIFPTF